MIPLPDTLTFPPLLTVSVTALRKVPPDSFSVPVIEMTPAVTAMVPPECVTVPLLTVKLPATVSVFAETVSVGAVPAPAASVTVMALAAAVLTTGYRPLATLAGMVTSSAEPGIELELQFPARLHSVEDDPFQVIAAAHTVDTGQPKPRHTNPAARNAQRALGDTWRLT